jgi:hypothetical protein
MEPRMGLFGIPGGPEIWIIILMLGFYAVFGVGFFFLLYFSIAKGVARGIREGFGYAPHPAPQPVTDDKPTPS